MIEISKQYLPQLSSGFSDPRVQVHIQDGAEFMVHHKQTFDVIITDSSDPIGEEGNQRREGEDYTTCGCTCSFRFLHMRSMDVLQACVCV